MNIPSRAAVGANVAATAGSAEGASVQVYAVAFSGSHPVWRDRLAELTPGQWQYVQYPPVWYDENLDGDANDWATYGVTYANTQEIDNIFWGFSRAVRLLAEGIAYGGETVNSTVETRTPSPTT
ncbi:MAG: hypothetical protein ACR2GY_10595 [Phycisphaerales bacterium]